MSTEFNETEVLLINSLNKAISPILFLGAGFSYGAVTQENQPVLLGKELAKNLYSVFYEGREKPLDISEEDLNEIKTYDLATLCSQIGDHNSKRKAKLYAYLVKLFKGLHPEKKNPFHFYIKEYPWQKIYTLNIDDLVEYVYESSNLDLVVQNEDKQLHFVPSQTQLIKLHGCVRQPQLGFIFSTDEYADSIVNADFKLSQFCNDFYEHDVIFVGTEFNENDISVLLKRYVNAGYRNLSCRYFFVSPKISAKLKNIINNNTQYFHIMWDTETFLSVINSIQGGKAASTQQLNLLKQYKFWDVSEYSAVPINYDSHLYRGYSPNWYDVFDNWDFENINIKSRVASFIDSNANGVIALYGKSYVGKSTISRRITVDMYKSGYSVFHFDFQSGIEFGLLQDYLCKLPDNSRCAVLVEEAAMHYGIISQYLQKIPPNISSLYFVTVSRDYYHQVKRFDLYDSKFVELYVNGKINYKMATIIISKLKEKNRISELGKYADNSKEQYDFIRSKNYIVDLLYTLTHGRGFEDYFKMQYEGISNDDYKDLFLCICIFSAVGIETFPREIVSALYKKVERKKFVKVMMNILDFSEDGDFKLRCSDFFEQLIISPVSKGNVIEIIVNTVYYLAVLFSENQENKWSILFQKLLKARRLKRSLSIEYMQQKIMFVRLENVCKHFSYYWMQRGIIAQEILEFEDAEVFLKQAQGMHPNSFHIKHALAKNMMERGLYEKGRGNDIGIFYFEEGESELLALINSPHYSKALCYSSHTLIDLKIKYLNIFSPSVKDTSLIVSELCDILIFAAKTNYDKYMDNSKRNLITFCLKHSISDTLYLLSENDSLFVIPTSEDDGYWFDGCDD